MQGCLRKAMPRSFSLAGVPQGARFPLVTGKLTRSLAAAGRVAHVSAVSAFDNLN